MSPGQSARRRAAAEPRRSSALWKTSAEKHDRFGNPDTFFGDSRIADSRSVTFTVTAKRQEFFEEITKLTTAVPEAVGF